MSKKFMYPSVESKMLALENLMAPLLVHRFTHGGKRGTMTIAVLLKPGESVLTLRANPPIITFGKKRKGKR